MGSKQFSSSKLIFEFYEGSNFLLQNLTAMGKSFTLAGVIFFSVQLNAQNICETCAHMINVVSYKPGR